MPFRKNTMELNPDCDCADGDLCHNCEDEYIEWSKIRTIAELKELFEANPVAGSLLLCEVKTLLMKRRLNK